MGDVRSMRLSGYLDLSRFLRFGLVGIVGFLVDAGIMQAMISLTSSGPVWARVASIPVAVLATFLLNRHATFRDARTTPVLSSLLRYAGVSAGGASINFLTYSVLVLCSERMASVPLLPLALASVIALGFNFLGSKYFAFR